MARETVIFETKPHPASFIGTYTFWLYVSLVTVVVWLKPEVMNSYCQRLPIIGCIYGAFILWAALILIPSIIRAYINASIASFAIPLILVVIGPLAKMLGYGDLSFSYYAGVIAGLLGVFSTEIHRRAHHYTITDRRIIIEYRSGLRKVRRDLIYERIQEFILEKPFWGKIFGFGNIYPLTSTGIGTGSDSVTLAGLAGGKGIIGGVATTRQVKMPRSKSFYMLYGIPKSEEIYDKIISLQSMSEAAPYLRELVDDVKKIVGSNEKERRRKRG